MRIRYIVPFDRKIIFHDHWEIPIQGGKCRIIEKDGYAVSLELVFEKQPLDYAPHVQRLTNSKVAANITIRDTRKLSVMHQLDHAVTFLECLYDLGLKTEEVETKYEGETPEEEALIAVKSTSVKKKEIALPLSFDMFTRAIMAAETQDGPKFQSTLAKHAREALGKQEFINSFRYSFLLIESLYGEGQFKKLGLQSVLKNNAEFNEIVEASLKEAIPAAKDFNSDTSILLKSSPTVPQVIDHLVEQRGFYFHGNLKRKNTWLPNEQGAAESLALLCIGIVLRITSLAASPIFHPDMARRHFENAMTAGAEIVYKIKYKFQEPDGKLDSEKQLNISMPGTKPTPRSAFDAAQEFMKYFQHNFPISELTQAECTLEGSDKKIFSLEFHLHDQRQTDIANNNN